MFAEKWDLNSKMEECLFRTKNSDALRVQTKQPSK